MITKDGRTIHSITLNWSDIDHLINKRIIDYNTGIETLNQNNQIILKSERFRGNIFRPFHHNKFTSIFMPPKLMQPKYRGCHQNSQRCTGPKQETVFSTNCSGVVNQIWFRGISILEKRILGSANYSCKSDDIVESIKPRFDTFKTETLPSVEHFKSKNKYIKVDTNQDHQSDYPLVVKNLTEYNDSNFATKPLLKCFTI